MPPNQVITWVQVVSQYGMPMLMLVGLAWFVYNKFWPLIAKQIDDAQKRLEQNGADFLAALERRDKIMEAGFKKLSDQIERRHAATRKRAKR